ncbi:cytochrome P450 [Mycena alexandri]|uniref:Cytochrome P450 n=1 Tax=Mycena alexandri TaxID=1745969 RepID=A0AAD6SRT3_9AGAR|nr:cytochrome P450 [Mycena alexandri]
MDYRGSLVLGGLLVLLLKSLVGAWRRYSSRLPYPPGPSPRFFVGNHREIPTVLPWLTYTEWGTVVGTISLTVISGDLVHARTFGQHIILVNSVKTAAELLDKRAHIYSDRPVLPMIELMGWDFNTGLIPYGDRWRRHRKMLQRHFRRDVARIYRPIQMKKFRNLFQTVAAAIILSAVYGHEIEPANDHFVTLSERAVQKLSEGFFPGAVAVNAFPILRYLPGWLPGCGFQGFAAECRQLTQEMQQVPFNFAKQNMQDGVDSKSVVAKLLEAGRAQGNCDEKMIQEVAAVSYADTTASSLGSFFFAMAVHPDAQKKAQSEIDSVVGTRRLPEFEDRPSLPFVEALFREIMRWRPALPLGVSHATTTEDIYEGYYIPKGATVISNIWAMTRDESIYPEPDRFNPDRFFTAEGGLNDDDTILTFGFGRRICPGRHTAEATVWSTIVSVLATFDIAKAKDADGNEIDIDPVYSDGVVSHPEPFVCSITPRSDRARDLVQATEL